MTLWCTCIMPLDAALNIEVEVPNCCLAGSASDHPHIHAYCAALHAATLSFLHASETAWSTAGCSNPNAVQASRTDIHPISGLHMYNGRRAEGLDTQGMGFIRSFLFWLLQGWRSDHAARSLQSPV